MSSLFYQKLALISLKKNGKLYIPYIITCICTIILFYNMIAIKNHSSNDGSSLIVLLDLGTIVTGIFAVIFLFYTNSFLIKRRKKEFGLFNVLGMEKKHIGIIMLWENVFISICTLLFGLGLGIALNKLMTLLLNKLLSNSVPLGFEVNVDAIIYTLILFVCIYFFTLLNNLRHVVVLKPIELLYGNNVGEKEPKTKWITTIIGIISLAAGYTLALTIKSPFAMVNLFFLAVILVIIGTYCIMTGGSIAYFKAMRKNKKFYYKVNNFSTVSGMLHRMKKNAVGLANICVLSTAVLVIISTTVAMYVGLEDSLSFRYPNDIKLSRTHNGEVPENEKDIGEFLKSVAKAEGRTVSNFKDFNYFYLFAEKINGNEYVSREWQEEHMENTALFFLSKNEYENISNNKVTLNSDEILLYGDELIKDKIKIFGTEYKIKETLDSAPFTNNDFSNWYAGTLYVVLPNDEEFNKIINTQQDEAGDSKGELTHTISFDLDGTQEEKLAVSKIMNNPDDDWPITVASKQVARIDYNMMYGGLFFIGIFLGGLFLMATVLIIYYKQIIEGFEDKERFVIMQKVGMSKQEVKKTISTQVLLVFFIPIIIAIIHIAVAIPMLIKLMAVLNLTNVPLFIICTICTVLIFMVIYLIVYTLTARVYYKIVNQNTN